MLTQADLPEGYRLVTATADEIEIADRDDPDLQIGGVVGSNGELKFDIRTVDAIDGSHKIVRGRVLFDLMMLHFGASVRSMIGFWMEGDNLAAFNRALADGKAENEAAIGTWTGAQAKRHGFDSVEFLQKIPALAGYGFAKVRFLRSS